MPKGSRRRRLARKARRLNKAIKTHRREVQKSPKDRDPDKELILGGRLAAEGRNAARDSIAQDRRKKRRVKRKIRSGKAGVAARDVMPKSKASRINIRKG